MLRVTDPLLEAMPAAQWITIGDGWYGSDAHYLRSRGQQVVATSLTDDSLAIARDRGWIGEYRAENAEALSFGDGACDFVLCKEAYH
ncbi:MAG: class I SAM-dependent methyltransferase, partial [Burkholderiales bacterium]